MSLTCNTIQTITKRKVWGKEFHVPVWQTKRHWYQIQVSTGNPLWVTYWTVCVWNITQYLTEKKKLCETSCRERLQATDIQTSASQIVSQIIILSGLAWKASYWIWVTRIGLKNGSKKWALQWLQSICLANSENPGYPTRFSHLLQNHRTVIRKGLQDHLVPTPLLWEGTFH